MSDELNDPIESNALRISVEVGETCDLEPRVRSALDELVAALQGTDDEVEGFATRSVVKLNSFTFDSRATGGSLKYNDGKVEQYIDKSSPDLMFKF